MSDDTQSNETPDVVESLDDVINDYNDNAVDYSQQQASPVYEQPQAAPQPEVTQDTTLDPFDEDQMNKFVQNNASQFGQVDNRMMDLDARLANFENAETKKALDSDVKGAVDVVNKIVGHDNTNWIEFQISQKVKESAGFQNLWNNRNTSPAAGRAFNKALTAIGNEMKTSTEMKSDPQLVENQLAANISQQNIESGSSSATTQEEALSSAGSDAERQRIWNAMIDS